MIVACEAMGQDLLTEALDVQVATGISNLRKRRTIASCWTALATPLMDGSSRGKGLLVARLVAHK